MSVAVGTPAILLSPPPVIRGRIQEGESRRDDLSMKEIIMI
jgi:hypothetical protein